MRSPSSLRSLPSLVLASLALAPLALFAANGASAPLDPRRQQELSADFSLAKVIDREGVATARAATEERWRSANENLALFAGTSIKTGARGANALHVRMKSGATLILGPGAQVTLDDDKSVHVQNGEIEVGASAKAPLRVVGPGGTTLDVSATKVVRARDGKLVTLDEEPRWLAGYKSGQSTEALGSLLANVDGREVPLTLGYHKVTVDVRDQIARTVIEESFVNHTDMILEGVFYFPLPGDASISSFGMWIGNELVEGDIVEKERARAIYEQILREKRDPGLLEWAGGNIFKARVYPITGEKRIKIAYTQVLPKEGDVYAYHYALQSELLKLHPLRQLAIEVTVSSAEPLAAVASPSHECRIEASAHGAKVSFDAQEYTPDRDFELRIATKNAASAGGGGASPGGLTFVDDYRGDDGYFLLRFSAPAPERGDPSAPVPATGPTDWLILADTSGSMNGPARETQIAFVEALLQSLADEDTVQLATCDVETRFAFPQSAKNGDATRAAALAFLEARDALGWSDLAAGFAAAFAAAKPSTQIVYVGDGAPTLGDADPGAFALKLPALFEKNGARGSMHAVVPGTTSEPIVLRALSMLGKGSVRTMSGGGGGGDPSQTAQALVEEVTSPRVTDVKVAFDGISVAAVYPETLPNLPTGRQQFVVGRFDPKGGARGRVTVSGNFAGRAVTYSTSINLDDRGEKQSFVPRLWARHHLDALLALGASPKAKERIIALSEEFQIATPYTSFLVLESEADRERFQVQKRMRMRDGEEFFAKGREDASFELLREQMKKAGLWHRGLRDEVLAELATMGREATELLRPQAGTYRGPSDALAYGFEDQGGWGFSAGKPGSGGKSGAAHGLRGAMRRRDGGEVLARSGGTVSLRESESLRQLGYAKDEAKNDGSDTESDGASLDPGSESPEEAAADDLEDLPASEMSPASSPAPMRAEKARESADRRVSGAAKKSVAFDSKRGQLAGGGRSGFLDFDDDVLGAASAWNGRGNDASVPELDALFPALPGAPGEARAPSWPDEILALLRSLDRRTLLAATSGGLHFATSGTLTDKRGRVRQLGRGDWLASRDAWRTLSAHRTGEGFEVQWLRGDERGAWRADWNLGRVRAREPGDERGFSGPFAWGFGAELPGYHDWTVTARDAGEGLTELRFVHPNSPDYALLLIIDRAKAVVVEQRTLQHGEVQWSTRASGFIEVAGAWWPTVISQFEKSGRLYTTTNLTVEAFDAAAFAARLDATLAVRPALIELGAPPKDLESAKQAVADGKARLDDQWLLLRAALARGEAEKAQPPLAAIRALAAGKPGLERIELAVLARSRRQEELRLRLLANAAALVAKPRECELTLAFDLLALASGLDAGNERLELLRAIEPVVRRCTETWEAGFSFDQQVVGALAQASRADELFAAQEKLAADWPDQITAQTGWASVLAAQGEIERALAVLANAEKSLGPWEDHELEQLFTTRISILWNGYRLEELIAAIEARLRDAPERANSWQLDQYLSAVVMLDREPQWWLTIQQWLDAARAKIAAGGKLSDGERAKVEAAVRQAVGQGWNCWWYDRRFQPNEADFLAGVARVLLDDERDWSYAQQILAHGSFRQTPAARAVFQELYAGIERGVATLPVAQLARRIELLRGAQFVTDDGEPGWQKIFDGVLARFVAATEPTEKSQLEALITTYGRRELVLTALRHRLAIAQGDDEIGVAAHRLLTYVMQDAWTAEFEAECLRLLPLVRAAGVPPAATLRDGDEAGRTALAELHLQAKIVAWYDFVNWAVDQRTEAAVAALPDVNLMPRRKLRLAHEEQAKLARAAVRERLAQLAAQTPAPGPVEWLALDRLWLDVLLKSGLDAARGDALALLRGVVEATNGRDAKKLLPRERVLASRCVTTLLFLLTKEKGDARDAHEQELLGVTDVAQATDHPLLDWRELDFERLVALDRGDALEAKLAGWFGGGDKFVQLQFGRTLAWIFAERGKLAEAARVMEAVAKIDELSHEDWLALADWYTALDRKADVASAKLAAWNALDENALSNLVNMARYRVQDRGDGVPAALDPAVADQMVALLHKAQWPTNYLWQVQNLYAATKDFRLLQCLPEGVIGHSAQGIYGFLAQLLGIQGLVDEEATVDRLIAQLDVVTERAATDVDRRALQLLRFLAQWKAATQQNGGGPHADAALAAMTASFDHPFAAGEARHLAAFLAQLGALAEPRLRAEQLRQLTELVRRAPSGSEERLALTGSLALVQWQANARDAALRSLGGELSARRGANGGRLPDSANDVLVQYGGWLQQVGDHAGYEKELGKEIAVAANQQRGFWLENQLHQNHVAALAAGTRTSLGQGRELYAAAQKLFIARAHARTNENQASQYVQQLVSLWMTARDRKLDGIAEDAERFAFDDLPDVLADYQYRSGQGMVSAVANALRQIAGPETAVEFLVTRAENEPHWLVRINQEFWDQQTWMLVNWRHESRNLDAQLERRLLTLTVKELRAEMRYGEQRAHGLFDKRWNTFWSAKRRDFAAAAKAELEAGPDDEAVTMRVAEYLFHGLDQFDDGIAILAQRQRAGRLSLDGQTTLCQFLAERKRFEESLPILSQLIERRPDVLELRLMQMRAFHGTRQREALEAARSATEATWRERKLWDESVIASLALVMFETDLHERSVAYYSEAIELHVKSAPNRGIGDGTLSAYYGWKARALASLGRTPEAVDAAAGAVISWGPRDDQRQQALAQLEQVLMQAESLDEYVATLDAEVAKSGLENPIVRKAIGKVYQRKGEWAKAAVQLRAAVEAAENDVELHKLLVEVYDRMKKPELAVAQLFASMEATGHDVALMRDLGRRLARLGATARAERVNTNLAEMLPNESESHQALAEVREEQERFADAAEQWQQVIRVRSKEPTGYLGLAKALIAAGEKKAAREPLEQVIGGEWESRFGDVKSQARELLRQTGQRY